MRFRKTIVLFTAFVAFITLASATSADSFSVRSIGTSDTGTGTSRVVVNSSFTSDIVTDYLSSGLVVPLTLQLTNTITSELYFLQITNVEFDVDATQYLVDIERLGRIRVRIDTATNVISTRIRLDTDGFNLLQGEEMRLDYRFDWSLLCGCNGSYSATSVIGESVFSFGT